MFQKKGPNNLFIVKLKNFTPGVKILEFKSDRKNEGFPKGGNLHELLKLRFFWGVQIQEGKNFRPSICSDYHALDIFRIAGKIFQVG